MHILALLYRRKRTNKTKPGNIFKLCNAKRYRALGTLTYPSTDGSHF